MIITQKPPIGGKTPLLHFHLGSRLVAVGAYPLFISLAILTVVLVSYLIAVRRGLPGSRTLFCLLLMAAAFDGAAFLVFVIWFTIFRYFNDFLRVSAAGDMPGYFYPVFYGLILLAAVLIRNFKACCRKQGKTWFQG